MINEFGFAAISVEIILVVMAMAIAILDLFDKSNKRIVAHILSLLTLLSVAIFSFIQAKDGNVIHGFGNMVVSNIMTNWLKAFSALSLFIVFIYSRTYLSDRGMLKGGEWYVLSLFSLFGMFVLISANNFLLIYLGLECLTLASYALVALRRDNTASVEASMKYFVLGAMASGFLLYGISMLYGASGTLDVNVFIHKIAEGQINKQILVFGLVFIVSGLAFKFGAVPFHMWMPDVYQGAPTPVTLLIASAPKLAAFAMAFRFLVEGLLPLLYDWQQMLGLLAISSLLIGNLAAIAQTNIKRMLAYSTIAQMGFVLMGFMAGSSVNNSNMHESFINAYSSSMFYVITYVLTTLASFGVILMLSRKGFENEEISDFAGLNQRSPFYAAIMAICLFSLAGIPPFVGFQAKLAVLQAMIGTGYTSYIALSIFAVVMSLIGAFYYLRVVKVMYFDEAQNNEPISAPIEAKATLAVNGFMVLVFGIFPSALITICTYAVLQIFLG